ncbi:tumor necrosis factor receptor superfamily member 1B isoform X2 [Melanotaenia boesemani]|uniref:tumor necrosis factor receptor superfamily member 1B isoform X2 n=1 Tax=Melanotaenia boesemani TaxID=1250792 RepID=UPI001C05A2E8|nr:tumor necrosis factor receptor superfamily member 1B isoform X2 [Melanotaenia boesemani]
MKDILVLLVLLCVQTAKVCSLPYEADSEGNCRNTPTEYLADGSNLCCKKCPPGHRLIQQCTNENDSICEPCGPNLYMENWNFASNCLRCTECKSRKGLQNAQECTSTINSMCVCQPGKFCQMGFNKPYCEDCRQYRQCKAGFGVIVAGTQSTDVKCEKCPHGTFSSHASDTDRCKPHKNCNGRSVVRKGDVISDTVCEEQNTPTWLSTESVVTTASTMKTTIGANVVSTVPYGTSGSTKSVRSSVTVRDFNTATYMMTAAPDSDRSMTTKIKLIIVGVIGFLLIFFLLLLFLFKGKWRRGSVRILPKIDANGNHESAEKNHMKARQGTSLTVTPEQVCLLENGKTSSNPSQCSNNSETSTRTDKYSSHESISPLQPTLAVDNETSALSEPLTLLSNIEPATPPPSITAQSSSQPTSPQIISPVTNSPHVNVNITLHIGNGSCGAPSFIPTDLRQAECQLPFGEEEESFSTPQQEAGKQMLMSVQEESASFNS